MGTALPALALRPPEDPTEGIKTAIQLKGMMAQQQVQQQQMQLNQMNIAKQKQAEHERETLIELYKKHNGNTDKIVADAPNYNISPETIQTLQLHSQTEKQNAFKLIQEQGAKALKDADLMQGAADILDKTPEADRPATYQRLHSQLAAAGVDMNTGEFPAEYPGADAFKLLHVAVKAHTELTNQAAKEAGIAKDTAQTAEANARTEEVKQNTAKIAAEMRFYQQKGLAPGVPLDAQEAADWLTKNPGKGPADFMKMKAGLTAQANASAQAGMLSEAAREMAAQNYSQTGQLPAGMRSPGMSASILNKAATGPGGVPDIAANKAGYNADAASLKNIQKNFDNVTAFENTALKNLDVFMNQAKKAIDSGSPWVNKPLRTIAAQGLGSEDQAALNAARTTALTEIAKVLSSANAGSGVLSDSARSEVEGLIGPGATLKQVVAAGNILKRDMANRHDSYQQQISVIKGRMKNGANQSKPKSDPMGLFD